MTGVGKMPSLVVVDDQGYFVADPDGDPITFIYDERDKEEAQDLAEEMSRKLQRRFEVKDYDEVLFKLEKPIRIHSLYALRDTLEGKIVCASPGYPITFYSQVSAEKAAKKMEEAVNRKFEVFVVPYDYRYEEIPEDACWTY
jgi:hypothetical protein